MIHQAYPKSTLHPSDVVPGVSNTPVPAPPNLTTEALKAPDSGRAWTLPVPDGAYATVPAWDGAHAWLSLLNAVLRSPTGDLARRKISITVDTLMAVAETDAATAHRGTGRDVATAHESVAERIGMCKRTVQRARELIETLGFATTIVPGRYLTRTERAAARALHGGRQIKAASIRALTQPRNANPVENVHLPRRGSKTPTGYVKRYLPTRTREAATRPEAITSTKKKASKTRFSPEVAKTASELTEKLLFLGPWRTHVREIRGHSPVIVPAMQHIGTICRALTRSKIDLDRVTATDMIDILTHITTITGRSVLTGDHVKNPIGYLRVLLERIRHFLDHDQSYRTRTERHQDTTRHQAQTRARIAQRTAERAAEHARLHSPEAIAARENFFATWRQDTGQAPERVR